MREIIVLALLTTLAAAASAKHGSELSCVSVSSNDSYTPLDDSSVLIRTGPRTSYRATFSGGRCPFMNRYSTLIVEQFGGQACTGDHIRALNPPQTIPGPICIIDRIEPYAEPPRAKR